MYHVTLQGSFQSQCTVETTLISATMLCTSQLKPPPLGSQGGVGDLTLTLVKRHQYPSIYRLEFRSNAPTPETRKMKLQKISKVSRKKDMYLNGEFSKSTCTSMQL